MYAYSNNGMSFRAVTKEYTAQEGEVLFDSVATEEQLASAFSGYADAVSAKAKEEVQGHIEVLERENLMPRALRDLLLSLDSTNATAKAEVQAIEDQISTLRGNL